MSRLLLATAAAFSSIVDFGDLESRRRLDSCTDYQYYNPRDTYTASQMVNYGHYLSRSTFCRSDAYYNDVFTTPIIICSILTFMLFCFFGGMFGRMFYDSCKCRPPREDKIEFEKEKTLNSTLFYILCFLVLILDQLVFVGNERVNKAIETLDDSSGSAQDSAYAMYVGGGKLISYVSELSTAINNTALTCNSTGSAIELMRSNLSEYSIAAHIYTDAIGPVQDFLGDVDSNVSEYGVFYRQLALYFIWALAIVFAGVLVSIKYVQFRYGMKQVMWFGVIVYMFYVVLCLPWTYTTSAMADFCMSPSYNAVKSIPTRDSLRSIGAYFSTCTGNCTLTTSFDRAQRSVLSLNDTALHLLHEDCPNNTALQQLRVYLDTVSVTLDEVNSDMNCPHLQDLWFRFWNNGVCQQLYSGTFFIWGSQILTSLFLFVLVVCVSVTYQFYGEPDTPYPVLQKDPGKVNPEGVLPSHQQQQQMNSKGKGLGTPSAAGGGGKGSTAGDGFGEMEVASPNPQPDIVRVISFHSDISDELNATYF